MILSSRAKAKSAQPFNRLILDELRMCAADPAYFISQYIKVFSPMDGLTKMKLFPAQNIMLQLMKEFNSIIVKHPRQAGTTSLDAAYALWQAMFEPCKSIGIVVPTRLMADHVHQLLKQMYDAIPEYIRSEIHSLTRRCIQFENGSQIFVAHATENVGTGATLSTLILADMAYVNPTIAEEMWHSLIPTMTKSSKLIIHSTPRIGKNLFRTLFEKTEAERGVLKALSFDLWDMPYASHEFVMETKRRMSEAQFKSEYMAQFVNEESAA